MVTVLCGTVFKCPSRCTTTSHSFTSGRAVVSCLSKLSTFHGLSSSLGLVPTCHHHVTWLHHVTATAVPRPRHVDSWTTQRWKHWNMETDNKIRRHPVSTATCSFHRQGSLNEHFCCLSIFWIFFWQMSD